MEKRLKLTAKERIREFNDGRLNCDGKWKDAIKNRIEELEKSVGIPELKKLLKENRYTWRNSIPDNLN